MLSQPKPAPACGFSAALVMAWHHYVSRSNAHSLFTGFSALFPPQRRSPPSQGTARMPGADREMVRAHPMVATPRDPRVVAVGGSGVQALVDEGTAEGPGRGARAGTTGGWAGRESGPVAQRKPPQGGLRVREAGRTPPPPQEPGPPAQPHGAGGPGASPCSPGPPPLLFP